MRILALTRYEDLGSSSRVRFYQYFPYLKSRGVEIVSAPFFTNEYVLGLYAGSAPSVQLVFSAYIRRLAVLAAKGSFDLLWVEKELLPWFPAVVESLFRAGDIPYVVDYDDAVFHRYDRHPMGWVRALLGNKIDNVMRNSALVIVGNEYLGQRAVQAGARNVEYLPSVVDVNQYHLKQHEQSDAFKIGWIGSPLTVRYLSMLQEALHNLAHESQIRLILMGAGAHPPLPGISSELISWSEASERVFSRKIDVGIMPLVDEPFERGKCGYKLVQYMAGGIPVVASPIGVNRQMVEPGVNGFLADSLEEWLIALRSLRDDLEKRAALGKAGHQKAKNLYNLEVTSPKLFRLLSSAMQN